MRHKYSKIEDDFLRKNVNGTSLKELTDRFNERFNLNQTEIAIQGRKNKLKIKSGIVGGQFPKGLIPWNKNTKGLTHANKTSFKKGQAPINHREVGEERITADGYIEIKVKEPNVWKLKHRVIYEKENGPIPKGYNLIFADGNKLNLNLDNLILVSNAELLILNNRKLIKSNSELTKVGSNVAKLLVKVSEKKRRQNND